ncbi:MAG: hypothetical protein U1D30_25645 [Planctomycetota bacterium]
MALIKKYKMYLVLALMMIGEGLALFMILPGTRTELKADDHESASAGETKSGEVVEILLGNFKVNNTADPGLPIRIECSVYATVDKIHEAEFTEVFKAREFRVKESVVTVLRRATFESIQEATLATLKRQIKEATSEVLGKEKSILASIVIPELNGREM